MLKHACDHEDMHGNHSEIMSWMPTLMVGVAGKCLLCISHFCIGSPRPLVASPPKTPYLKRPPRKPDGATDRR